MNEDQLFRSRHSLSHLLAMALLDRFPGVKLAIGPAIDNGFYYDAELPRSLEPDDLAWLQERIEHYRSQNLAFEQSEHSIDEARIQFADQPYKLELIDGLAAEGAETVGYYQSGAFIDLCKGPHVATTAEIPAGSFELTHVAGAYWRGDEKRPMLQRFYGLAFASAAELTEYKELREAAKARDHRKLGAELDLFTFSELVGSGLPLWTPKGTVLRNLLDDFVWELRRPLGYERVEIPHITKKDLYVTSGHWEKFQHELFHITTREGHEFVMKPMNCPHHTQIFARKKWSYRELPQRYANTTMCYRDEQTGELNGLSRVRSFCQDDAHVFCRHSQAKAELEKIWNIVETFYVQFGFSLKLRLSLRDPKTPEAYLGNPANWDAAEATIRSLAEEHGMPYFEGLGEAAFYAPKLDFMALDSLGRQWQVATIQLDMIMPERFGLTCTNEQGEEEPVLMIHAAIMGSLDRFLSVYIEHVAGNFPFWLAPVQIALLPVSDRHHEAAHAVAEKLRAAGLRVDIDLSSESVGKKIRAAALQKIPAKIVLGDRETAAESVDSFPLEISWRADLEAQQAPAQPLADLIGRLAQASSDRSC